MPIRLVKQLGDNRETYRAFHNIENYDFCKRCYNTFNSKNIMFDPMITIFKGKFFRIDICYEYSYFEVFGITEVEFRELSEFYDKLRR